MTLADLSLVVVGALSGAISSMIANWAYNTYRRNRDETVDLLLGRFAKVHPQYDPDFEATVLIDNASPVSIIVRSIKILEPSHMKLVAYFSLAEEHFEVESLPINLPVAPFAVGQASFEVSVPEDLRQEVTDQSIVGEMEFSRRGKTLTSRFKIPRDDIIARFEELDDVELPF